MRLLVVNNILTPYNVPFFAALDRPGVTSHTVLLAETDRNRRWTVDAGGASFSRRVLPSVRGLIERIEAPIYLHWGLWSEMRRFRPDVVAICGYHYFATLEVLAYSAIHGVASVLWSGSHLGSGFIKRRWADWYKRTLITRFDAYMTYGTAAREQLIHYGAPTDRIVVGCNTVDVHAFRERARRFTRPLGPELRLLYVGRLVAHKNVPALIEAVATLQREGHEVHLTIVGSGPQQGRCEAMVEATGARAIRFLGFLQGDALVQAYAEHDVLVLPSTNEPWGLVVNEAFACGRPAVVSTRAGAANDLITHGGTGTTFDPEVPGNLAAALRFMLQHRRELPAMGARAQDLASSRDPRYYADRLVDAAHLALDARRIHPTPHSPHRGP